ncbi:hypothetical protein K8T06_05080, partial [bacterium]|nr:hypothetical protein [bacterium]
MSRHCLYCAKELPKSSTNNFCSKDCWNEYKKLKAMDVGTDKQATVLLKRSELAGVSEGNIDLTGTQDSHDKVSKRKHAGASSGHSEGVFEDVRSGSPSPFKPAQKS